jgi:monoterpene epsilon-lactone hydrolase
MTSWQAKSLKVMFRLQRLLHPPGEFEVARERADLEALATRFQPAFETQRTAVQAGGVPAEWILPPGARTEPVVLYLHGGGYVSGSIHSHRHLATLIARAARARALIVDYRLAPEHPFPAALEDAQAAYGWLLANDVAPGQIVIAGDSAGGGLALATALVLRDAGQPLPAAIVGLSPWTDLAASGESMRTKARADLILTVALLRWFARMALADTDPRTPLASPLYADLRGLPPLLIQVGSDEILLSDSVVLAERARAAGLDVTLEVWPGMQRIWHFVAPFLPEGRQAVERVGAFVASRMA